MSAYILTDKHGGYIGFNQVENKYVKVYKRKGAYLFESRLKAKNVRDNSIPKHRRKLYYVFEVDEEEFEMSLKPKKVDGKSPAEIKRNTEVADKRYKNLNSQLSEVDKELCDLNHYIEFNQLDLYRAWVAFSMLQERLRKIRRAMILTLRPFPRL